MRHYLKSEYFLDLLLDLVWIVQFTCSCHREPRKQGDSLILTSAMYIWNQDWRDPFLWPFVAWSISFVTWSISFVTWSISFVTWSTPEVKKHLTDGVVSSSMSTSYSGLQFDKVVFFTKTLTSTEKSEFRSDMVRIYSPTLHWVTYLLRLGVSFSHTHLMYFLWNKPRALRIYIDSLKLHSSRANCEVKVC